MKYILYILRVSLAGINESFIIHENKWKFIFQNISLNNIWVLYNLSRADPTVFFHAPLSSSSQTMSGPLEDSIDVLFCSLPKSGHSLLWDLLTFDLLNSLLHGNIFFLILHQLSRFSLITALVKELILLWKQWHYISFFYIILLFSSVKWDNQFKKASSNQVNKTCHISYNNGIWQGNDHVKYVFIWYLYG